jgi:hypothetical protein
MREMRQKVQTVSLKCVLLHLPLQQKQNRPVIAELIATALIC